MAAAPEPPMKRVVRERVLREMLGGLMQDSSSSGGLQDGASSSSGLAGAWKVLVLDAVTTRVVSSALRMSDILDAGVSVVEDLDKRREPLPLPAVYFISPSPSSVTALLADFASERSQLYPAAHVFFSSGLGGDQLERIRRCKPLLAALRTLKELNLEFVTVDGRTWVTDHPHALIRCMGERAELARAEADAELDSIAARLASLLASLHEAPSIRYRVGRAPEPGDVLGAEARASLTQRLALKVSERVAALQRGGVLPARDGTCDLLLLDRSLDPLAPVVHEWGYESLTYDLLTLDDNVIRYQAEAASGATELKEHRLDEGSDELWGELRHGHIADVYTQLARRLTDFQEKNTAAKYSRQAGAAAAGGQAGGGNIKALIAALPQFREVLGRLSVHIFISSELKTAINSRRLTELGEVEQGLVYGEAGSADLIKYLQEHAEALSPVDKMRLIMAYIATHPEKLDGAKKAQWARLARLDPADMDTVCNLAYVGVAVMQRPAQASKGLSFGLRGGARKKPKATLRKPTGQPGEQQQQQQQYALCAYEPALGAVLDDALAGRLAAEEYAAARSRPDDDFNSSSSSAAAAFGGGGDPAARVASARTNRSALSWARPGSAVGSLSGAMAGLGGLGGSERGGGGAGGVAGRRLLVFIVGGVTRSEMRAVHELCRRTGRDVLLGSTAVLRPTSFLSQLRSMGPAP